MVNIKRTLIRGTQWFTKMGAKQLLGSMPKLRSAAGDGAKLVILPKGLEWSAETIDGLKCEWLTPPGAPSDAVLLYLHGGGGVLGLYNSSRKIIGHIAAASHLRAFMPDYRLAPEYPFPDALNDCLKAYDWLLTEEIDPRKIVILGDSMGGYLTISTLLRLRDSEKPLPAAAVCISPVTDPTCSGKTMKTNADSDALLSPQFMWTVMAHYVQKHDLGDPYLSPLTADLSGLPPILIQAGEGEILLDDARRFSERAKAAGVDMTLEVWPAMWHDWHVCVPDLDEANQAIKNIAEFVHEKIG
ncbi:MAG: alpha/beta hydrolase [Anaerolinea sp.]|nr:alpha/beta hydrolase [Anaerolinea sp.]